LRLLRAGLALGAPFLYLDLLLAGASSLMMSLTHDATDTLPIILGAGYASMKGWWVISFIMSVVNLAVWGIAGSLATIDSD
jgi:DASS family divalent anion:Na+ symporter|tara:strand:+ start:706 stop:948 length:243 start_codon:yes stop_codon:yes gene_type:complete